MKKVYVSNLNLSIESFAMVLSEIGCEDYRCVDLGHGEPEMAVPKSMAEEEVERAKELYADTYEDEFKGCWMEGSQMVLTASDEIKIYGINEEDDEY